MKEPIYVFSCGCRVEIKDVIRGRRTLCSNPDHKKESLINRIFFCQECGCEILMDKSGPCPSKCKSHTIKKGKYEKVEKKQYPEHRIFREKVLRGKDHCKRFAYCSANIKVDCRECNLFEPAWPGLDPKKLTDLMGGKI